MTVGLQPEIPPLCNLPIVSSALGLPFLSFGKRAGAFIAPHYYFLPVSALMSEPSGGWTEKKKMMEVAQSCGAVGFPIGEEVSSCQFGPLENPPHLCRYCWSCFSRSMSGCSWSSFHPSDAHFWSGSCFESRRGGHQREKVMNSPLVLWCFEAWSSYPIHLLLFIFQSPQIATPCILSRVSGCIQWETQGRLYLLHLIQNQKPIPIFKLFSNYLFLYL